MAVSTTTYKIDICSGMGMGGFLQIMRKVRRMACVIIVHLVLLPFHFFFCFIHRFLFFYAIVTSKGVGAGIESENWNNMRYIIDILLTSFAIR